MNTNHVKVISVDKKFWTHTLRSIISELKIIYWHKVCSASCKTLAVVNMFSLQHDIKTVNNFAVKKIAFKLKLRLDC